MRRPTKYVRVLAPQRNLPVSIGSRSVIRLRPLNTIDDRRRRPTLLTPYITHPFNGPFSRVKRQRYLINRITNRPNGTFNSRVNPTISERTIRHLSGVQSTRRPNLFAPRTIGRTLRLTRAPSVERTFVNRLRQGTRHLHVKTRQIRTTPLANSSHHTQPIPVKVRTQRTSGLIRHHSHLRRVPELTIRRLRSPLHRQIGYHRLTAYIRSITLTISASIIAYFRPLNYE